MARPPRTVEVRHLVGVFEVCKLAGGIPRSTLQRWRQPGFHEPPFPRPLKSLKSGDVFDASEVRAWLEEYRRPRDA